MYEEENTYLGYREEKQSKKGFWSYAK